MCINEPAAKCHRTKSYRTPQHKPPPSSTKQQRAKHMPATIRWAAASGGNQNVRHGASLTAATTGGWRVVSRSHHWRFPIINREARVARRKPQPPTAGGASLAATTTGSSLSSGLRSKPKRLCTMWALLLKCHQLLLIFHRFHFCVGLGPSVAAAQPF